MRRRSLQVGGPRRIAPAIILTITVVALVAACGSTAKILSQVGGSVGSGRAVRGGRRRPARARRDRRRVDGSGVVRDDAATA